MEGRSTAGKSLLSNYMRHANTHNRIREEKEMWEKRRTELSRDDIVSGWSERAARRASPLVRGHLVSDTTESNTEHQSMRTESHSHSPYHWTRELVRAEEKDPYCWGHSGYKEQHPEEFLSSSSSGDEATPTARKRKKEHTPPKAKKKLKKSKKSKKSRKHRKGDSSSKDKKSRTKRKLSTDS